MSLVQIEIQSVAPAAAATAVWALSVMVLLLTQRIPEAAGVAVLLVGIVVITAAE